MNKIDFHTFLKDHLSVVEPLSRETNLAYWKASISGKKEDFDIYTELQLKLSRIYAHQGNFEQIKSWKNENNLGSAHDKRQVELLYYQHLRNQIDPKLNEAITTRGSEIENRFNIYRGKLNGRTVTSNDILEILKNSPDSELRKQAWEAGKGVGREVSRNLIALVRLRNEAAQSLGYANYYSMSLDLNEQEEEEILTLFEELESCTREPFRALKREMDETIGRRFGITADDLEPWHYQDPFFQEAPDIYDTDLDRYFEKEDILELVKRFYHSIGLDVADIIERSDLFEKSGKEQHAYCTDIDRRGDIRILANIKNDENWLGTMLHELGHAVYDKYIDPTLPYLIRQEAHIFTTEASAMFFGRLTKDPDWIQIMTGISDREKVRIAENVSKGLRLSQLIFTRWCQVMLHFERELYGNPGQDLDTLWWKLVTKYQMIAPGNERNAPDWASKIHIVSVPVYYHNYMLGELLASQFDHTIQTRVLGAEDGRLPINDTPGVGAFFKEYVFKYGATYRWDKMVEIATGEKLTPKYFVEQFVE